MSRRSPRDRWIWLVVLALGACDEPPPPIVSTSLVDGVLEPSVSRPSATGRGRLDAAPRDTLRLRRTIADPTGFSRVRRLTVVGRTLVVMDQLQSPHMSIFDLGDGSLIQRLGIHGRDGTQMIDPAWAIPVATRPPEAWVFDYQRQRLFLVRLDAPPDSAIADVVPLRTSGWITQPNWIGGRLIANGLFSDYTLAVLDRSGNAVRRIAADPPFDSTVYADSTGRASLNKNHLAFDPIGRRFVLAYQNVSRLDFFHATGAAYASVAGPRPTVVGFREHKGHLEHDRDATMAYAQVDASGDHVYALFCGCRRGLPQTYPTTLHVFTWDGEFVRELAFDRPVLGIAMDGGSRIYAHFLTPLPEVGEFTLDDGGPIARGTPTRTLAAANR